MSNLMSFFVNLRAKAKFGQKDVVFWKSAKTGASALRKMEDALEDADIERGAFFKDARITGLPVYDDLPPEGQLDFTWCERYELSEDGKAWLSRAGQPQVEDSDISEGVSNEKSSNKADLSETTAGTGESKAGAGTEDAICKQSGVGSSSPEEDQNANSVVSAEGRGNGPEGLGYNVNGEPMADVIKKMDWPVVEMSLPMRWMAQMGKATKTLHLSPEEYGRVMAMTAPQDDDEAPLLNNINLLLVGDLAPELDKLDLYQLFRLVVAVEKVASTDERLGLHLL